MIYLFMGAGVGLIGIGLLWLRNRIMADRQARRRALAGEPASVLQDKRDFIRDVCDGNVSKADALVKEKWCSTLRSPMSRPLIWSMPTCCN